MTINNCYIGLRGHDIGADFGDMLKNADTFNVRNIQLAMTRTLTEYNFYEIGYDFEVAKKIKKALDDKGVNISVLSCYINPVERDEKVLERDLVLFENFIRYAKVFDAGVVGTETGFYKSMEVTRSEENYQFFLKNIRRLVKKAEKNNVVIGIEPVDLFTIHSPETMARLLSDVNSDNLAVILDLSNIITVENYECQHKILDSAFELLGDKIRVIHLKDFKIIDGKKKYTIAGTGDYDIEYLFSWIAKIGIKPDIILDETSLEHHEESVENIIKRIE